MTIHAVDLAAYLAGHWDWDLVYLLDYPDLDALVDDLERYLGHPIDEWVNFSASPYASSDTPKLWSGDRAELIRLVAARQVSVPNGVPYRLPSFYWRQIEEYGDFDMEREFAKSEEE